MMMRALAGALSAVVMLAACGASGTAGSATERYVMRVDRTFDKARAAPSSPNADLPAESYVSQTPVDRWQVTVDGASLVLTAIGQTEPSRVEGKAIAAPAPGERRFDLGAFAGGHFIIRGDDAELTIYGSGVPVISSERGKLVR